MHDNYNLHGVWRFKRTHRYFTDNESYINMDKIKVVSDSTCRHNPVTKRVTFGIQAVLPYIRFQTV